MFAPFDWTTLCTWTQNLLAHHPQGDDLERLKALEHLCRGGLPAAPELPPGVLLPSDAWLLLPDAELRDQVRLALAHPGPAHAPDAWVLPACALVACREYRLELASELLRLMLHRGIAGSAPAEVAEFLAFQQRPGGECGYLNPLEPAPFAPEERLRRFTLPLTLAIAGALRVYAAAQRGGTEALCVNAGEGARVAAD